MSILIVQYFDDDGIRLNKYINSKPEGKTKGNRQQPIRSAIGILCTIKYKERNPV